MVSRISFFAVSNPPTSFHWTLGIYVIIIIMRLSLLIITWLILFVCMYVRMYIITLGAPISPECNEWRLSNAVFKWWGWINIPCIDMLWDSIHLLGYLKQETIPSLCMYVYMYVLYVYMYVCICVCMYVCVCVCMCMYVYVCVFMCMLVPVFDEIFKCI